MTTILSFLFVLGVLIFVHELGHFLMARRIGVRVLTFSLGFGPKLLSFKRGDTEYCISAIPLGGYVKMAGENPDDGPTGASDEFLSKTKWQRFQVLIMGPVMNLVLALIVMAVVLYQGAPRAGVRDAAGRGRDVRGRVGRGGRRDRDRRPDRHRRRQRGRELGRLLDGDRHEGEPCDHPSDRARRPAHGAAAHAGRAEQVRDRRHRRAARAASGSPARQSGRARRSRGPARRRRRPGRRRRARRQLRAARRDHPRASRSAADLRRAPRGRHARAAHRHGRTSSATSRASARSSTPTRSARRTRRSSKRSS